MTKLGALVLCFHYLWISPMSVCHMEKNIMGVYVWGKSTRVTRLEPILELNQNKGLSQEWVRVC